MLFFDLNKLEEQSCDSPNKFMALLWYHHTKRLPNSFSKYKPSKVSLTGTSFLLNPQPLFDDKTTDIIYKIQYIKLCAKRDYNMYKQYKYKALNRSFYPDLAYDNIKHNNLLSIGDKEILFKYEEDT